MSELENLRRIVADYDRRWKNFLRFDPDPDDIVGSLTKENILFQERIGQLEQDNEILHATNSDLGDECYRLKTRLAELEASQIADSAKILRQQTRITELEKR
jgi:predicted nuclease with TOPRIM domain